MQPLAWKANNNEICGAKIHDFNRIANFLLKYFNICGFFFNFAVVN